MPQPPPAAPPALVGMTPYLLDQLGRAARRDLQSRVKHDLGLTLHELWVLAVVDEGPTDTRAVAHRLGLERGAVLDLARDLAGRGLVGRDGKHGVEPTRPGRRALRRAGLAAGTVTTSVLGALGADERRQLQDLLTRAYGALGHDD